MNQEELVWEAPSLLLEDIFSTQGGAMTDITENLTLFPISGIL